MTRPAFASEQVERLADGRVRFELRRPRASQETHLVFEAQAFLRRLAWLIPPPRLHVLTYHGVLAPAARWRSRVVPEPLISDLSLHHPGALVMDTSPPETEHPPGLRSQKARQSWAMLMKRIFALDVLECEHCGGPMRVIAALQEPAQIRRVLSHLGLEAEVPRLHPARAPPETELWPSA